MKTKFVTIKMKTIVAVLLCVLAVSVFFGAYFPIKANATPKPLYTIVIDAGHGGLDGGSEGVVTGNTERELNLEYAKKLQQYLTDYGFKVIMTRNNLNGLYPPGSKNRKKDDMNKRKEIIESSGADMVISLHMNSFVTRSSRGAQVFYKPTDEHSRHLAESIQTVFIKDLPYAKETASVGDFFILNCSEIPSVLVECGFLSNKEEDVLLATEEYRDKICYAVFSGVIRYLYSEPRI